MRRRWPTASTVREAVVVAPFAAVIAWVAAVISPSAGDFFQFWFAGHLVATGSSPYDQSEWVGAYARFGELASVVRHNCPVVDAPACRWAYPPWTGWFLAPFGLLGPQAGIAIEGLVFVGLLALGVLITVQRAQIRPAWLRAAALLAFAVSTPFLTDAISGHFDGLMLIGLALVAWSLATGRALPLVAAATILALKPHLFLAFGPLVLLWLGRERQLRLAIAPAVLLVALGVVGLLSDPRALPTLTASGAKLGIAQGTLWSLASRGGAVTLVVAILLVALAAAMIVLAVRWSPASRRPEVFVAAAAAFSLGVAPYAHLYDHILLMPAVAIATAFVATVSRPAAVAILTGLVAAGWAAHAVEQIGRTSAGLIPVAVLVVLAIGARAAASGAEREPRVEVGQLSPA